MRIDFPSRTMVADLATQINKICMQSVDPFQIKSKCFFFFFFSFLGKRRHRDAKARERYGWTCKHLRTRMFLGEIRHLKAKWKSSSSIYQNDIHHTYIGISIEDLDRIASTVLWFRMNYSSAIVTFESAHKLNRTSEYWKRKRRIENEWDATTKKNRLRTYIVQ